MEWLEIMECRLVLSKNCRNTQSIAFTAYRPVNLQKNAAMQEMEEAVPNLWLANTTEEAREIVAERLKYYIQQEKLKQDEVVVLTTKGKDASKILQHGKLGGYELTDSPDKNGILFETARRFKGLEASAVIIVDIDEYSFATDEHSDYKEDEPSEAAKLLYVAATRAKTNLDMVALLNKEQLNTIAAQLTGTIRKRPIKTIESELGVKIQ
jgi:superfamily I DNA/RNA helicase